MYVCTNACPTVYDSGVVVHKQPSGLEFMILALYKTGGILLHKLMLHGNKSDLSIL